MLVDPHKAPKHLMAKIIQKYLDFKYFYNLKSIKITKIKDLRFTA